MPSSISWPSPASNRAVNDPQHEGLFVAFGALDGLSGTPLDSTMAYADGTGQQVKIRPGKAAHVRGHGYSSDPAADIVVPVTANASGQSRIDRLVLGLDRNTWNVTEYVKAGTPGAAPAPPALQQDLGGTGKFEISLGQIGPLASGYTTIPAGSFKYEAWYTGGGVMLCTSTTRPFGASIKYGQEIYESDTKRWLWWDGTQWRLAAGQVLHDMASATYAQFASNVTGARVGIYTTPDINHEPNQALHIAASFALAPGGFPTNFTWNSWLSIDYSTDSGATWTLLANGDNFTCYKDAASGGNFGMSMLGAHYKPGNTSKVRFRANSNHNQTGYAYDIGVNNVQSYFTIKPTGKLSSEIATS